jgi:hypothetical protein
MLKGSSFVIAVIGDYAKIATITNNSGVPFRKNGKKL